MKKWTKKAEQDKIRYQEEMKHYVPTEEEGGRKKQQPNSSSLDQCGTNQLSPLGRSLPNFLLQDSSSAISSTVASKLGGLFKEVYVLSN